MAHLVESMMFAGQAPWHGLGTAVEKEVRSEDALRLAELDWEVLPIPVVAEGYRQPVPRCRAIVRQTDGRPLGIVGERYRPVQNKAAFSFFDEVVGTGEAIYHTAGSLDGGRRVWILAKLPEAMRLGADEIERFILLSNSHDGSAALQMFLTPVRVVCQNTLNLALSRGAHEGIPIRHTASATTRIEDARRAIGMAKIFYERFESEATVLLNSRFSDSQMVELAEQVLPAPPGDNSPRLQKARSKVFELFSEGRGHGPIRGTAWAALNAVAEYADHHRRARAPSAQGKAESKLKSIRFGTGLAMKRQAHAFITQQLAA